jgi:hypothetical protein
MAPFKRTTLPAQYSNGQTFGRPSEYRAEYCAAVIDHMAQGYSLTAFAGVIRVARDTVYQWIKAHADFADAVSRAQASRVAALETKLLRSRKGAETTAAIFALRNACPDEWRDVKHTETLHTQRLEVLTDAQLYAIAGQASGVGDVIDADFRRESETG